VWSFALPKRTCHSCHWCCNVGLGITQDLGIAKKISKFCCSDDEQITHVVLMVEALLVCWLLPHFWTYLERIEPLLVMLWSFKDKLNISIFTWKLRK
jgi:hypothetical protein